MRLLNAILKSLFIFLAMFIIVGILYLLVVTPIPVVLILLFIVSVIAYY